MNIDLLWAFLTGLAGSLHCLGMCGPLVIAYSLNVRDRRGASSSSGDGSMSASFAHHLSFQTGRIAAYGVLGGIAAALVSFGKLTTSLRDIRAPVTIGGGMAMIFLGLIIIGAVSIGPLFTGSRSGPTILGRSIARCFSSPRAITKILLGFLSGFLPCMLSWAMVVKAAVSADIFSGFLLMIVFGIGTVPTLLFTGFFASMFSIKGRVLGERLAGFSIVMMGLVMLWKGVTIIA